MPTYTPQPIDTSKIVVPKDLLDLAEILARNVHENWSVLRINQGWRYGPMRNDSKKLHPCLIPFDKLTEDEKEFDYKTAMETLKGILALGYKISDKHEHKPV